MSCSNVVGLSNSELQNSRDDSRYHVMNVVLSLFIWNSLLQPVVVMVETQQLRRNDTINTSNDNEIDRLKDKLDPPQ